VRLHNARVVAYFAVLPSIADLYGMLVVRRAAMSLSGDDRFWAILGREMEE
jgi:hypothetical protein